MKTTSILPIAFSLLMTSGVAFAQWHAKDTEWPSYTADIAGSRYRTDG